MAGGLQNQWSGGEVGGPIRDDAAAIKAAADSVTATSDEARATVIQVREAGLAAIAEIKAEAMVFFAEVRAMLGIKKGSSKPGITGLRC